MDIIITMLIAIVVIAICFFITPMASSERNRGFLICSGAVLFIVHCFKDYNSLPDLPAYVDGFYYTIRHGVSKGAGKFEIGWRCLNAMLSSFCPHHIILFAVTSFIIVYSYLKTAARYSLIRWLSVYLFGTIIFCQSLFVLRQHVAIAICLMTVPYILKRDFWKFALGVCIATTLHTTAIIFLPAYFIYSLKINKKFWVGLIIILGVSASIFPVVMNYLLSEIFGGWYGNYAEEEGMNMTTLLINICVLALFIVAHKNNYKLIGSEKLFFIFFCCNLIISFGGLGVPGLMNRLSLYYSVSMIYLIPNSIHKLAPSLRIPTTMIVVILFFLYSLVSSEYLEKFNLIIL